MNGDCWNKGSRCLHFSKAVSFDFEGLNPVQLDISLDSSKQFWLRSLCFLKFTKVLTFTVERQSESDIRVSDHIYGPSRWFASSNLFVWCLSSCDAERDFLRCLTPLSHNFYAGAFFETCLWLLYVSLVFEKSSETISGFGLYFWSPFFQLICSFGK